MICVPQRTAGIYGEPNPQGQEGGHDAVQTR